MNLSMSLFSGTFFFSFFLFVWDEGVMCTDVDLSPRSIDYAGHNPITKIPQFQDSEIKYCRVKDLTKLGCEC